jgi:hypothetical protein
MSRSVQAKPQAGMAKQSKGSHYTLTKSTKPVNNPLD